MCGAWDVDALLRSIPAWQFERWWLLYRREPWGEERSDYAMGTLIAHANALKGVRPAKAEDYMPYLARCQEPEPLLSDDDVEAAIRNINASLEKMFPAKKN